MDGLSKELFNYAAELTTEGLMKESLYDYKAAKAKYFSARFIIDELLRELYHALRFS